MHTATLLTNPENPVLTTKIVEKTKAYLGGTEVTWLAPNKACDIDLPAFPDNWEDIWQELQAQQIDLCIQPTAGRKKQILIADMDSTMIQQECIDELAAEAGVGEKVAGITARAMNGELDFEAALIERVGLLKGLDSSIIAKVIEKRITLMPGGPALLATMKTSGAYCALVSGGFTDFTSVIAARLGFDENRANTLLHEDGKLTGEVGRPILGRDAKVEALNEIAARLALAPANAIAVGDGANDLGMLKLAGAGVALHAKPVVAAECSVRLNFADLTGLLYLQGYKANRFIRCLKIKTESHSPS